MMSSRHGGAFASIPPFIAPFFREAPILAWFRSERRVIGAQCFNTPGRKGR